MGSDLHRWHDDGGSHFETCDSEESQQSPDDIELDIIRLDTDYDPPQPWKRIRE
jgi:hypothetical protein